MTTLLTLATGVKADDAFVVWDAANATLYFSYGAVPTKGGSWTNEAGNDVTATNVWSGTQVTETGGATPNWVGSDQGTCTKVIFEKSFVNVKPTSCYWWFCNFTNLTSIEGLANLDTSEVTNMSYMFQCYQGEYLDLSSFDTSKVTNMLQMFCGCTSVKAIVIGDKWNTTQVTVSDNMFGDCFALVGEDGTKYVYSPDNDVTKANADADGYLTSNRLYDNATTTAKYDVLAAAGVSTFKLSGRTIKGGKWNTLCIPSNIANLSASALAGAKVKKLKEYTNDDTSVTITFEDATSIEAGKPYLVKPTADITDPVFDFAGVAAGSTSVTGAEFKGTYQASTLTAPNRNQLFLQNDKFYYPGTSNVTLNAFRAYFSVTKEVPEAATSRGIEIDLDGDGISTGIDFIENKATGEVKVIYDLSGRRVANPSKGLYIVNGKKVVIK